MSKIYTSASKIVFILLAITACGGFLIGQLSPDNFMILASSAWAFYFSNKGNQKDNYLDK
jgi:hypothetical protein